MNEDRNHLVTSGSGPSPTPVPIAQQDVERKVQKVFSPSELFGQDYIWDSVLRPLSRQLSVLCLMEKLIREAAHRYPDDWHRFSLEVDRLGIALSELEEQGQIRTLEMRALKQFWPKKRFDLTLSRKVQRHAAKLTLPDSGQAPNVASLPKRLSQRQLKATDNTIVPLLRALFCNEPPTIGPEEIIDAIGSFSAERAGRKPEESTKDILRIANDAAGSGRKLKLSEIAEQVFEGYAQPDYLQRGEFRQRVSRVLKQHGLSHILSRSR